ncbi:hypothetical protein [Paenibacillus medicaginis]|uniref:Uncharacterized protein n=1 Tax=Paenibacillus medicaginis TaxID=1470560 RepID=A0ABV5C059_9BACL
MQRNTSTTSNQAKRAATPQANRTAGRQSGAANSQVHRTAAAQDERMGSPMNVSGSAGSVACRKCKSTQVVANKKGYSFAKMFITLGWMGVLPLLIVVCGSMLIFLTVPMINEGLLYTVYILCGISILFSVPVSILVGFISRNEIINGCMNCGFKWAPAKKK